MCIRDRRTPIAPLDCPASKGATWSTLRWRQKSRALRWNHLGGTMSITRKKLLIISIAVLALALALVTVAGCGGDSGSGGASGSAATPFKIGVAGSMTGQYATYGVSQKAGAEIAMAELNASGGVNGGQVSIAIGDDLGDPKEAVLVAQKYIDDTDVVVVDGHQFSGATIAAGAKYESAGLPMISPSATSPDISTLGAYIWRICMTDAVQGLGLANYSVNTLGKQKIAIMYDNSDYCLLYTSDAADE